MKNTVKKLMASLLALVACMGVFSQSAMAAEVNPEEAVVEMEKSGIEDTNSNARVSWVVDGVFENGYSGWLEAVHVDDVANGGIYTYNNKYIKIKPAWRPSDSTTSMEELEIRVYRKWNNQLIYARRILLSEDTDGKADGSGWWYYESPWIEINSGSDYYIQYELYTATGYTGTGAARKGDVSVWIETTDNPYQNSKSANQ